MTRGTKTLLQYLAAPVVVSSAIYLPYIFTYLRPTYYDGAGELLAVYLAIIVFVLASGILFFLTTFWEENISILKIVLLPIPITILAGIASFGLYGIFPHDWMDSDKGMALGFAYFFILIYDFIFLIILRGVNARNITQPPSQPIQPTSTTPQL
ncbi:MAG: hypothetical protein CEN90_440 [Parcubacteria group bacterium Licking1014_17]|nr:MAG: hypothetical protein CEN90_440 [Parcubacteria group bacterium Licking1014_17]